MQRASARGRDTGVTLHSSLRSRRSPHGWQPAHSQGDGGWLEPSRPETPHTALSAAPGTRPDTSPSHAHAPVPSSSEHVTPPPATPRTLRAATFTDGRPLRGRRAFPHSQTSKAAGGSAGQEEVGAPAGQVLVNSQGPAPPASGAGVGRPHRGEAKCPHGTEEGMELGLQPGSESSRPRLKTAWLLAGRLRGSHFAALSLRSPPVTWRF